MRIPGWPWLREDHAQHVFFAVGVQINVWCLWVLLDWPHGAVVGALAGGHLFYGREHRDHQIKACAELKCNLKALPWTQYLPWTWCRDGRWDFLAPVAVNTVLATTSMIF